MAKKPITTIEDLAAASQQRFLALDKKMDAGFQEVHGDPFLPLSHGILTHTPAYAGAARPQHRLA